MIEAITGLPGAGKTLKAIEDGMAAVQKGRPVYVCGFDWVDTAATGFQVLDDFEAWETLPKGAVLIVDECQRFLPNRPVGSQVPRHVEALTRHRHLGLDLVLITQEPRNIDSFVRRLIGRHRHLVNPMGLQRATVFEWQELQEDPKKGRKSAMVASWAYPAALFDKYRSAVLHTKERRIPWKRLVGLAAALLACVAIVGGVFWWMARSTSTGGAVVVERPAPSDKSKAGLFASMAPASKRAPLTVEEYTAAQVPRVPAQPWSAPLFDGRKPKAEPELYCMAVDTGRCVCHTEQGTRYSIERRACLAIALNGQYNPYRAPPKAGRSMDQRTARDRDRDDDETDDYEELPPIAARDTPRSPPQSFPVLGR